MNRTCKFSNSVNFNFVFKDLNKTKLNIFLKFNLKKSIHDIYEKNFTKVARELHVIS